MGAKRPTSETTHGRNDPVPGVPMDRLPLIFRRLLIPLKGSYCECQQIHMTYVASSHNPQVINRKMAECLVPVSNISFFVNNAKPWLVTGSSVKGTTTPNQLFEDAANKNFALEVSLYILFTLFVKCPYVF